MAFDLKTWIVTHKPQAALAGGAAGAVGIGLYRKRKNASTSSTASNNQVPTDATTAAQVVPYGGGYASDYAGGVPYDPSAFNSDPSGYLAQISQSIADLQTTDAALAAGLASSPATGGGTVATKPTTGGKVTKPAHSPKPAKKPTKHPRSKGGTAVPPPPVHNPRRPRRPRTTKKIKPTPMQPRRRR